MKKKILCVLALLWLVSACDPPSRASVEASSPTPTTVSAADEARAPGLAPLPPGGEQFDPPIEASAVPQGAWYCAMGTVHYARPEKGDGSCPVCGMSLTQKGATPEGSLGDGHQGHDHP